MLTIRDEQMEVFQPVAEAAFERELVEHLRGKYKDTPVHLPARTIPLSQIRDETMLRMVRDGIARGREYGISGSAALAAFVSLMFVIAPNFDDHPPIQNVLKDDKIRPDDRVDQLAERIAGEDWEVAKLGYDATAWNVEPQEE